MFKFAKSSARKFFRFTGAIVSALTSRRANRCYRRCLRLAGNALVFLAFVLMTIALVTFWIIALAVEAADRALTRYERPAPTLVLAAAAAPVALLAAAPVEEPRVLITPAPVGEAARLLEKVVALPAAVVEFVPIVASREVAVSANKLRQECDRLRCLITDEAAYTMDERRRPNFQGFIDDLEQCAREVARLYCKRSKSHDSYKESLLGRANTLIERNRKPQGEIVAHLPKPRRLQIVRR